MSEHTPIPWTVRNVSGAGWEIRGVLPDGFKFDGTCHLANGETSFQTWVLAGPASVLVACERWVQFETEQWQAMQAANAAFIVRAVNSHDELVAACEAALERIEAHGNAPDMSGWIREQDDEAIAKITAALAKARG